MDDRILGVVVRAGEFFFYNSPRQDIAHRVEVVSEYLSSHFRNLPDMEFAVCLSDEPIIDPKLKTLCSARKVGTDTLLMPNIYLLSGQVFNVLNEVSEYDIPLEEKSRTAVFAGYFTGHQNLLNDRYRVCKTGSSLVSASISGCYDHAPEEVRLLPKRFVCIPDQLKHRFIISIDGNSSAWDRLIWAMSSNSVVLKFEGENEEYWYEKMVPWEHYIPVNIENVLDVISNTTDEDCIRISTNAKAFVSQEFSPQTILENMNSAVMNLVS